MKGFYGPNPEKSAEVLKDGWTPPRITATQLASTTDRLIGGDAYHIEWWLNELVEEKSSTAVPKPAAP